ncbi:dienelactone hydrolase family protein [Bacillus weihaiensis]|uniref:Dienelactone hydrolase domain-containing protein n=1 Tax=Bacillus weihaiensis TaxID=1547283 RepID=A0A1L3MRF7_9BACI|nr:dienelactone hydrolase family protein [Bacillus weihaiensis]APH04908.1 hypothetical protein A9C19_09185 [Bacillus weihaiensis]
MNRSVVIIIHEIYGVNDHISTFSKRLTSQGFEVICPNLLDFELPFDYEQEEEAYHHFMNNIGFDHSVQRISSLVEGVSRKYERVFLIGFSVGATIAWLCSKDQSIDGIICFYGSRIREYVDIVPLCPTLLIFPEMEKSFNVDELIAGLGEKGNVTALKFEGLHGFCNPYSAYYHKESAQESYERGLQFLREQLK